MTATAFSSVLGERRGRPAPSQRPGLPDDLALASDTALDEAVAWIASQPAAELHEPENLQLVRALGMAYTDRARSPVLSRLRHALDALGRRGRRSDLLVDLGGVLHVWPTGRGQREMNANDGSLLCGLRSPGPAVRPYSHEFLTNTAARCEACWASAARHPELTEWDRALSPLPAKLVRRRLAEAGRVFHEGTLTRLARGAAPTQTSLLALAERALAEELCEPVAALALDGGETALARVLAATGLDSACDAAELDASRWEQWARRRMLADDQAERALAGR